MVERQRRSAGGIELWYAVSESCFDGPRKQVWKSGEEMDGDHNKKVDVGVVVVIRNGGEECHLPDERNKPRTRVEELWKCIELFHRPDDKVAE